MRRISRGTPFDEIVAYARQRISKLYAYLGVYSLKYLKKSGRISGGAAFVGEALGLRPISLVRDGAVTVCDKVRGDRNLFPRILALLQRDVPGWQRAEARDGMLPVSLCRL